MKYRNYIYSGIVFFIIVSSAVAFDGFKVFDNTVIAPPVVSFTFNNNNACSGQSVSFTSNVSGAGPFDYDWNFGGQGSSTQQNPNHSFLAIGCGGNQNFTVSLTVTDTNNETTTVTNIVSVKRKPDIAFVDPNAGFGEEDFENCNATSIEYIMTVNNDSNSDSCVTSYSINWGDGNTVSNVSFPISHTYQSLGSFNMVISAVGTNGCQAQKTYTVKNSSNPEGGIVSPGTTVNLCTPINPIEFAISNWGVNPPDTIYNIDYGDGTTLTLTQGELESSSYYNSSNPSASADYPIPYAYTESNCPNSSYTVLLDVITSCGESNFSAGPIRILEKPEVSFNVSETVCINENVLINNTSTSGYNANCNTDANWFWDMGDGTTYTDYEPIHSYSNFGTYTISLYAVNGCGETDPVTQEICVEGPLNPTFTTNAIEGCSPLQVNTSNTTDESVSCVTTEYLWEVTYSLDDCGTVPGLWSFTNGTNENSLSPSFNFETPGTYTLSLTASNSCGAFTTSEVITVKQPPLASINPITSLCGASDINPVAVVETCVPNTEVVTYNWSFPGGTPATSSLLDPGAIHYTANGDYEITLSVTNSCGTVEVTQDFSISESPTITNTNTNQTICSGSQTEAILITSDNTNTTFSWTSNNPANLIGYVASGTSSVIPEQTLINESTVAITLIYTVVPEIDGCFGDPVVFEIIIEPAPLIIDQPISNSVCLNGAVDALTVSIQGTGTPNYQWYENTTNDTSSGTLIAGATSAVFIPPADTLGTIYYYVVITFSGGDCNEIISETAQIEVVNSSQIDSQPLDSQQICIDGVISDLSVIITGGTGTTVYQWFSNTTNSNTGGTLIPGANSSTYSPPAFTGIGTFYYYVEVSSSGSGCGGLVSEIAEVIVVEDPLIVIQPIVFQSICQNAPVQDLEVSVSGGLGNLSFQWYVNTVNSNSGGVLIPGATSSNYTPPVDVAGDFYYYCVVTQDVSGCEVTSEIAEVEINIGAEINVQPMSAELCLGDTATSLTVSYSNGTGTAVYQWYQNTTSDTSTGTAIAGANNANYTPIVSTVGTVYYYCVITFSAGGCSEIISDIAEIIVNETPAISSISLIICSGNSFEYIPSNADVVPLNTFYTWSTPSVSPTGSVIGASEQLIPTDLITQFLENTTTNPAIVTYTVLPVSGDCIGASFEVQVTVNPSISVTAILENNSCYESSDASIEISIVGGIPFVTGDLYQVSWSGPNGFTSTDEDIFNLEIGTYILNILDDGGCPYSETFTITEPDELIFDTINFDPETITCFGANDGSIDINILGGNIPYVYAWTLDGLPFSTNEDLVDLGPGTYEVTVTDIHNCGPITQSFLILEPPLLEVTLGTQTNVLCFGDSTGAIDINVTGGRPIYTYSWVGPNGFTSAVQNIANLTGGAYTVTITDSSGCMDTLDFNITQNDEILIDVTATEIECYGDNDASITINNITGGIPPYSIAWSNFGTGMVQTNLSAGIYTITITDAINCLKSFPIEIEEAPLFLITPVVTQMSCSGENDASIILNFQGGMEPITVVWNDDNTAGVERNNLAPGTYTVTITDGTPCVIQESFTIFNIQPLQLSANVTHALDCDDTNSGSINLLIAGGTPPFNIVWSNGATTEDLNNIPPNTYHVTVTDAHGCEIEASWDVNRFEPLALDVDIQSEVDCVAKTVNQSFVATASGGVPPFQFIWSSGTVSGPNNEIMTTDINGLVVLEVVDSQGCSTNFNVNVEIPVLGDPSFDISSFGYTNYGVYAIQDPIQFTNTATGDFVSILWDFGDGNFSSEINPLHTYLQVGNYVVTQTVTYPFGCVYIHTITLIVEKGYQLIMPDAFTPNDDGLNDFFGPEYIGLKNLKLHIYDTWGSLIYSESGEDLQGWDGKVRNEDAENGNYYYTFSALTFYDDVIEEQGPLVIIK